VRAPDGRAIALGAALTLLLAPVASGALPDAIALAYRIVAALLSAYLLWMAVRTTTPFVSPPRLGGTAEAAFVGVGFVLGLVLGYGSGEGSAAPLAAALATGLAALSLLVFGRDPLRVGTGAILGLLAAGLGQAWLTGTTTDLAQLALASAILAAAAATAWLTLITFRARGALDLETRGRELREIG
jgi:hypothetical protein